MDLSEKVLREVVEQWWRRGMAEALEKGRDLDAGVDLYALCELLHAVRDTLPRSNAVKNVVLGCSNGVAALAFVFFGDVRWASVVPLGAGLLIGLVGVAGSIGRLRCFLRALGHQQDPQGRPRQRHEEPPGRRAP